MPNPQWKLITNVGYVDYRGARLWCHCVSIDLKPLVPDMSWAQIRGMTYGGLPVFTVWVDAQQEITLHEMEGGRQLLLSNDGNTYNLDAGIRILAGGPESVLDVFRDDFHKPMQIQDWLGESHPFGKEMDRLILPYASGGNYPRVVWTPVPGRGKAEQHAPA